MVAARQKCGSVNVEGVEGVEVVRLSGCGVCWCGFADLFSRLTDRMDNGGLTKAAKVRGRKKT